MIHRVFKPSREDQDTVSFFQIAQALGAFLLLCAFVVISVWFVFARVPGNESDVQGAPMQVGVAKVLGVTYHPGTRSNPVVAATLHLRFRDQDVDYSTYEPVKTGGDIRVRYRIGKSGSVHIEGVESQASR